MALLRYLVEHPSCLVTKAELRQRVGVRLEAGYGTQAGDNVARRNAYPEAIAALRKGLALLAPLPNSSERTQCELTLQLMLG